MKTKERVLTQVCTVTDGTDQFVNAWRDLGKPLALPAHETLAAVGALLDEGCIELHPTNAARVRLTASGQRRCAQLLRAERDDRATA